MIVTQHYWQPRNGNETVCIRQIGNHTEVWMHGMTDPIIVIENSGLNIIITDISQNPNPRKIEMARVYDNL